MKVRVYDDEWSFGELMTRRGFGLLDHAEAVLGGRRGDTRVCCCFIRRCIDGQREERAL